MYNSGNSFKVEYSGRGCGIGFLFVSPYTYEMDSPKKTVDKALVFEEETFTYNITQYINNSYYATRLNYLPGIDNSYTDITITDTINANCDILNTKVINELGTDVTRNFTVNTNNNVVTAKATSAAMNNWDFYNHLYTVQVQVRAKTGTGLKNVGTIPNIAQLKATYKDADSTKTDTKNTNTVNTGLKYNVTLQTSRTNGSITQGTTRVVNYNGSNTFDVVFTPKAGYVVERVTLDGTDVTGSIQASGGSYTSVSYTHLDVYKRQL